MSEKTSYNPHQVRQIQCRKKRLDQQLPLAIQLIHSTKLMEGEILHGLIHWEKGLIIDDNRLDINDVELKHRADPKGEPVYPFRYDGEKLEIFL